jgi:hypothetical protein
LSGVHLPCGCAVVSAILVFFLALQYLSVSMAILCAAIEFSTPIFGKLAQAPKKRPAAAVESLVADDVGPISDAESAAAVGFLSITQLVEHEAAIREWLDIEPGMGNKKLCTMMLSEKSCHVKPITARNCLIRLRREPDTPSRKKRRLIQGSCVLPDAPAGVEVTYLDMNALSAYDADIREWLSIEPNMGKQRLAFKLFAKTGLRANLMAAQNYLSRLRKEPGVGRQPYVFKRPAGDLMWRSYAGL